MLKYYSSIIFSVLILATGLSATDSIDILDTQDWTKKPSTKLLRSTPSAPEANYASAGKEVEIEKDYGKSILRYSEDGNVVGIEYFLSDGSGRFSFYKLERFQWEGKNLVGQWVQDSTGKIKAFQKLSYDHKGQLTEEKVFGDLTGRNQVFLTLGHNGLPNCKGCETYSKSFSYSDEGRVIREEEGNGKVTLYSYKPETDLISQKFICDRDKTLIRYFYEYDEKGKVTEIIQDDGLRSTADDLYGITERRFVRVLSEGNGVERVEETYFDLVSRREVPMRTVRNTYSDKGLLQKQAVYDSLGNERYSSSFEYDELGKPSRSIGPMGDVSTFKYDDRGRKVYEQAGRTDSWTEFVYNDQDQLIRREKKTWKGESYSSSVTYDENGRKIAETDGTGNVTSYELDGFGREIKAIYPSVLDENSRLIHPTSEKVYDISGNVVEEIDAKGFVTRRQYNIQGEETEISHPDGSVEKYEYHPDGTLAKAIGKNGSYTCYTYDVLARAIKAETYTGDGHLLGETSGTYNAYHLTSSTDASGHTTLYYHDGAGRQLSITEITEDGCKHVAFEYNPLGQLQSKREWFGDDITDAKVSIMEYDYLGKIIEQRTEDGVGGVLRKVSYSYDADGNRSSLSTYTHDGKTPERMETTYNFRGEPSKATDALGNVTVTVYDDTFRNDRGQRVLQRKVTDPLGFMTVSTMDAMNREELIVRKDPFGKVLLQKEIRYDAAGNKARETIVDIQNSKVIKRVTVVRDYGPCNRLERLVEAEGTPLQKQYSYVYGNNGEQLARVKPDGVQLCYDYDSVGRVSQYRASDNSFHYEYQYDSNHRVLAVLDHANQLISRRSYDEFGRMVSEKLANGLTILNDHDALGRRSRLTLHDGSSVEYAYNAVDMKSITRLSSSGKTEYVHSYEDYDLSGRVLKERLIDGESTATYERDALGRLTGIHSPFWSADLPKGSYDAVGNLLALKIRDSIGELNFRFSYDKQYRVASEEGLESHSYAYDNLQNCIQKDGQKYSINELNQLEYDGNFTYQYDINGNLVKRTIDDNCVNYGYDALGRLTEVREDENLKVNYIYDVFNRRMGKKLQQWDEKSSTWKLLSELRFLYDGKKEIGAVDSSGEIVELRILGKGHGAEVGAAVAFELDGKTYIPTHDHRGDITSLVDPVQGQTVETYRYSAFGEEQIFDSNGERVASSQLGNSWRFSSKRYDEETGLLYFGGRYYDPSLSRWMTPDPMGFGDGPNLYAYVHNKPLTAIDLYGHFAMSQMLKNAADIGFSYVVSFLEFSATTAKNAATGFGAILEQVRLDLNGQGYFYELLHNDIEIPTGVIGKGEINSLLRVTYINGINSGHDDVLTAASFVSSSHGNVNVHYVANPTLGLLTDILNATLMKVEMKPRSTFELVNMWKEMIGEMGGTDGGGKILHYAHSCGGMITSCARDFMNKKELAMIEVRTMASPELIRDGYFAKTTNYVSVRDGVPMVDISGYLQADPFGVLQGCMCPMETNVIWLGNWYDGWPLVDHTTYSDTYKSLILTLGESFQEEYGTMPR
ncbi:MAG: RHS repeat-associated protein [Chlamydiales bacterium]|jgi:RHS repeat-associated protein